MVMLPILKLLTPKVLNAIVKYVFEKNTLDYQVEAIVERIELLEKEKCCKCKKQTKEKKK